MTVTDVKRTEVLGHGNFVLNDLRHQQPFEPGSCDFDFFGKVLKLALWPWHIQLFSKQTEWMVEKRGEVMTSISDLRWTPLKCTHPASLLPTPITHGNFVLNDLRHQQPFEPGSCDFDFFGKVLKLALWPWHIQLFSKQTEWMVEKRGEVIYIYTHISRQTWGFKLGTWRYRGGTLICLRIWLDILMCNIYI